jgi:Spore coat polysaccharide biosynthesis protein F, CMP-KDO synthetase homolog
MKKNKKNKIVGIIQARMGSKRLPKKMSLELGGYPIIEWVINRVKKCKLIDKFILATSLLEENDYLINMSRKHMIKSYRGSEENVLSRFVDISKMENPDFIVRICADNPFIDHNEINRLIKFYLSKNCDYACNHQHKINSGYADGFGAEIFSYDLLKKINNNVKTNSSKEHVTLHLWKNQKKFNIMEVPAPPELNYPNLRFDLDNSDDLLKLENLVNMGINIHSSAKKIVKVFNSN